MARFVYKQNNDFEFITNIGHQTEDLYLSCFGRSATAPEYRYGPAIRAYDLIHVILHGKGTLLLNKMEYHISEGQAFFIPKGITADYFADAYDPWEYVWIGYNGSIAALFDEQAGFSIDNPVRQLHVETNVFETMLENILPYTTISISDELYRTGWLYRMLALFTDASRLAVAKAADIAARPSPEHILELSESYIKQNFKHVSVTSLAEYLQVNRSHLFRLFKRHYGISPQQFIMDVRIKHARMLLTSTNLPIKQVATDAGFGDAHNFSRQFKKYAGLSPHIYRNTPKGEISYEE